MELETLWYPTAHTSLLATAATPLNEPPPESVGVETARQFFPSKCTASGCELLPPTAQISLSAIAVVADNDALLNCLTTLKVVDAADAVTVGAGSAAT